MKKPIFDELTAGYKLLFLFSFCLIGMIIFSSLSVQLASILFDVDLTNQKISSISQERFADYRHAHQLATALNQLGIFALAALSFFQLTERESLDFSKIRVKIKPLQAYLFMALGVTAIFGSFVLNILNLELIDLAGAKDQVDEANQHYHTIQGIILSGGWKSLLINIIVIGVLPGICEELFYRGGVLQYLLQMTNTHALKKGSLGGFGDEVIDLEEDGEPESTDPRRYSNKWLAIIVSALMFAVMHMEWDGFLTRFSMGVLLAWVFVGTGSLLAGIIIHVVYNTSGVILLYFEQQDALPGWIEKTPVIGLAITGVIIFFLRSQFSYSSRLSDE